MSLDVKFSATDINLTQTVSKIKEEMEEMDNEVKKTSNGVQSSFGSMAKAGAALAVGFGAIKVAGAAIAGTFDFFAGSVKNASDLGETISKVDVIFGEAKESIESWANTSAKSLGQSKTDAMDAAAQFAIFGKAAGLGGEDLVSFSKELVGLSADLASFNNATPEEAILAIGSALRGEAEPMRRFGVLLDDASLKNEAFKLGLTETTNDALTPQQKVLAAHALIMAQTITAQGDFARTSGGLANQQRTLTANLKDFSTEMGQVLLPVVEVFIKEFNDRVIPMMRSFAKVIGQVDMKAFAEGVVNAITGASNAMGGFNAAIRAFNLGEFGLGFTIAFASIKLQAADSLNSIYANAMAAIQASATFLMTAFGPGSGIYTIVGAQFDILSSQFQIAMIGGVKAIATALTSMFDTPLLNAARKINPVLDYQLTAIAGIAKGFDGVIGSLNKGVENSQNKISNAVGQIGGDFKLAGQEARKAYDQALSSSNKLIDTEELKLQLKKEQNKLDVLEATARSEAAKAALKNFSVEELTLEIGKERVNNAQRIKELDADIASAKRQGNKEELGNLESMKAYYKELQASREKGLTLEQSITNANIARQNVIDEILKKNKKIVEETGNVKENMERIKTLGDLIAKTNAAAPMKTFTERSKEARAEVKKLKDFLGGDFSRMNIFDLAKKLGISTTRKSSEELLKMIEEKLKKINATPIDLMINKDASKKDLEEIQKEIGKLKTDKEVTLNATSSVAKIRSEMAEEIDLSLSSSKGTSELSTITSVVEAIRDLVKSLEKKLPMPALGA
jgi:hypothetical protein